MNPVKRGNNMIGMEKQEFYKCPKCGEKISKHQFYYDGCREHVTSYHGIVNLDGTAGCKRHCNTGHCEINHNCKKER